MMSKNRQYDNDFKVQAVKLAKEIGTEKAAKELNVPSNTLYGWVNKAKVGGLDISLGERNPEDIELLYTEKKINAREKALLIMSLIYAMDKIANTCGHYDAYRQGIEFDRHLVLSVPNVNALNNPLNQCFNEDANELVKRINPDLVYIDPPYNSISSRISPIFEQSEREK